MAKEEKKLKSEKKVKKEKKHFFREFKAELKKVIWPTSKQLTSNTIAVIVIVLITAAIVFVLDFAFGAMTTYGIDNLKDKVKASQITVQDNNTVTDNSDQSISTPEDTAEQNQTEAE